MKVDRDGRSHTGFVVQLTGSDIEAGQEDTRIIWIEYTASNPLLDSIRKHEVTDKATELEGADIRSASRSLF